MGLWVEKEVNGKLSLMGRCGFVYFGLGNLWYHLGEEDKPFARPSGMQNM